MTTNACWRVVAAAASMTMLGFMAACGGSSPDPSPSPAQTSASAVQSTSTEPTTTPTATPTPSTTSPDQRAKKEVLALVKKYYEIDEAIATDKRVPLNRYYEVAGGSYVLSLLRGAQLQRAKGYRVIGKVKVRSPEVTKLELPKMKRRLPSATISVCLDVAQVSVVDKKGNSVVAAGRANAYLERLTLKKQKYGWRVVDGEDSEVSKCAA